MSAYVILQNRLVMFLMFKKKEVTNMLKFEYCRCCGPSPVSPVGHARTLPIGPCS